VGIKKMSLIWEKSGFLFTSNGIVILRVPLSGMPVLCLIGGGIGLPVDVMPDEIPPIGVGNIGVTFPPGACGAPDKGGGAGVPAIRLLGA
jgi:hypothetical protein